MTDEKLDQLILLAGQGVTYFKTFLVIIGILIAFYIAQWFVRAYVLGYVRSFIKFTNWR